MKKILYLFSDTGGGHRASAKALVRAVDLVSNEKTEQQMVDVFAECGGFLNILARLYSPLIRYAPKLWGVLWHALNSESKLKKLEKLTAPLILRSLTKLIETSKPDLIVSVHPLLNHLTNQAMRKLNVRIPFITVVTDPVTFHMSWVDPGVDLLVVATDEAREQAIKWGMPEAKIKVLGLPIDPKFSLNDEEKSAFRTKARELTDKFTVLMMGGGEGSGNMYDLIRALDDARLDIRLIVVSGRNKQLEERLKKEAATFCFPSKILGFTDKVPELMMESDLIITKAGPGSIAEALAMNLPMIITSWIPGQEEGNVDFVREKNIGRICTDPKEVARMVKELKDDKSEFRRIKDNIRAMRKPDAALDIARTLIGSFKKGTK